MNTQNNSNESPSVMPIIVGISSIISAIAVTVTCLATVGIIKLKKAKSE